MHFRYGPDHAAKATILYSLLSFPFWVFAQNATPDQEYGRYLTKARSVAPLSSFGDQVSLRDGSLSFRHVDAELPGTGPTIRLVRTFRVTSRVGRIAETSGNRMGEWELALPRLKTLTSAKTFGVSNTSPKGWQVGMGSNARCTQMSSPGEIFPVKTDPIEPDTWWAGYQLVNDAGEEENVLAHKQEGGQPPHVARTKNNWLITCLPSTSNGQPGEAFQAIAPDGTRYWLDYLTYKTAPGVGDSGAGYLPRNYASMLVTRAEDRFGNWVNYSYSNGIISSIDASDGRRVVFTNDGVNLTSISIASSSANQTWQYQYGSNAALAAVILPDGSAWRFSLDGLFNLNLPVQNTGNCNNSLKDDGLTGNESVGSITSPAGATAYFAMRKLHIGRSYATRSCWSPGGGALYAYYPKDNWEYALSTKTVSGPGMPQAVWRYAYSPGNSSWSSECTNGCASTVWTDVTDPDGTLQRSIFSNRADGSENLLLRKEVRAYGSNALLSVIEHSYAIAPLVENSSPYPWRSVGRDFTPRSNWTVSERWTPIAATKINQDNSEFSRVVNSFDSFSRPMSVTRSSAWFRRTDTTTYYDNNDKWVLGQLSSAINNDTGLVERQVVYNANSQPSLMYSFGKLQQAIGYYGDGMVAFVKDGNENLVSFSSWKRGIPQSIRYGDNSGISAVVDDRGWIASTTDESGYTTSYGYDGMGRMNSVSYPSYDSTNWNTSTQKFEQIGAAEYDLAAGHWRQTVATGNAREITYYDGMWRPLVTRKYDAGNESETQNFQRFAYDANGRQNFASYPGTNSTLTKGTWTSYDGLGRAVAVSKDSEIGLLSTTTEYLPSNQTRVTDPRGNRTLTGYQVFDEPGYDKPVWIQHPEGANTDITRDLFGKPTSIARRSGDGSRSLVRTYAYNASQELCRSVESETGATLMGYDSAGNMKWSAAGLPSDIACDQAGTNGTIAARRVDRTYDARNRLATLIFPDGNGNQRWTYWPDGLVKQITTVNSGVANYNSYTYNRRRLLVGESQGQADGETWAISSIYNANGHLAMQRYPTGMTVDYAPNALGQAMQAGSYATGASYYPNGALRQFTYGNGIVHNMVQNARQLPDTSEDAFGGNVILSDGYDYDANGNVAAITDGATGRNQRGNRTMTYDGLDRLRSTISPMFGTAEYRYDALDNLTYVKAPGREHFYCYDPYWHLTNIKINECSGSTVVGLAYDLQGNLTNKNGQGYVFDFGNRLRAAINKESYRYDGNGRRTQATQSSGSVGSMYDQAGVLRFQKNQRRSKMTEYVLLGGSNVAEVEWSFGQVPSMKDALTWTASPGSVRYVVEESIDGLTWTSVYEGDQTTWTSLSRPSGTYSYRVLACTQDGACTSLSGVSHVKRSASDIVPLLYQLLLN
ncbi:RHS repeat domain-containing protein [Xanthomonas arboricola]|uniref:RHS repeat domain-containing protein n=1 Tax=Xanthomonas arboricola TaxID=56448 RepID=UPI001F498A79|nr:RHS repeat protein [Xanthomonas arboricola]